MKKITPNEFLKTRAERVVLDVRSPAEFEFGHIPGAVSFPLFDDDERAQVGTIYKNNGKEAAFEQGLKLVGPKMADFVKNARRIARHKKIAVHCWRGGQRSGSMAWLLAQAGFDVVLLDGGYKNYRQHVRESFKNFDLKFVVLSGKTGSGKTKILQELEKLGEQIIDLEGLAHHKGSAFGDIGEQRQPSIEHFENLLFDMLEKLDPARRVWLESESRHIGKIPLPLGFWEKKQDAPLVNIEIPHVERVQNLVADYAQHDRELLKFAFQKIDSKLGGLAFKQALAALDEGDFATAAEVALVYYDKTYLHSLERSPAERRFELKFDFSSPAEIARQLRVLQHG